MSAARARHRHGDGFGPLCRHCHCRAGGDTPLLADERGQYWHPSCVILRAVTRPGRFRRTPVVRRAISYLAQAPRWAEPARRQRRTHAAARD